MSEISSELQFYVKKILKDLHVKNYTVEMCSDSTKGNNYMASIKHIDVHGTDKDGNNVELHFIGKNAPQQEVFRNTHAVKYAYEREIFTYERILPIFEKLQKSCDVPVPFHSYPFYYVSSNVDPKELIIMKNMKTIGYRNLERQKSVDFNHALLVIKELGRLHALSFALKKKNLEHFREIAENTRDVEYHTNLSATTAQIVDLLCIFALRTLDPLEDRVAFDRFNSFRKTILNATKTGIVDAFDSEHAVIVHGNIWLGNLLFKYQKEYFPSDVCMLDWQFLRLGSPAFDISQLLFLCCSKEVRSSHYSDLLQAYYDSLTLFLKSLGEDANEIFPFDVLIQHLKKYSVLGLSTAIRVFYFSSIHPDDLPDISNMKNLQEVINIYLNIKRDVGWYNKIVRDIILDYINFGYDM